MKFFSQFHICFRSDSETEGTRLDQSGTGGLQTLPKFAVFTYNELKAATQGFRASNKLGEGGFASVYKGWLRDGSPVAVKILSLEAEPMQGARDFITEIAALSDIRHENLVILRGCCVEGAKRFLVFDYMENNSLARTFLGEEQSSLKFSWPLRRKISIGVAKGLAYLHEEIKPHIVHRDIKASNILLDQNFTPKVADFGLAKLFPDSNASYVSTRVAGTLGYLSLEYAISGHLTRKSDVYSFGVLLLEIVSGRAVVGFDLQRGEYFLVDKVWEMYQASDLLGMVDPALNGIFSEEEAVRFLKVGLLCVQETTKLRPTMSSAVKMLTSEIDVQGMEISKPGVLVDLMDVKVGSKHNFFSGESANVSSESAQSQALP